MRYHANTLFVANQQRATNPTDSAELKKKQEKIAVAQAAADRYQPRVHDHGHGQTQRTCPFGSPLAHEDRIVELMYVVITLLLFLPFFCLCSSVRALLTNCDVTIIVHLRQPAILERPQHHQVDV
jgi:hypothetical protein